MIRERWKKFQDYIAERLKVIDPHARSTKGSGNQGEMGDVNNKVGLNIECKFRNTKSATINHKVWDKVCEEIPLHSPRIPMLALENEEGKRWAVLDLDDFLDMFIDAYNYRNSSANGT